MATRLPLHEVHARLGAAFGEVEGHLAPLSYGDVRAEHAAIREGAGVIDRSWRGAIGATGRDRAAFLHGMLSNDIQALTPGQGCEAAFLDAHGKIVSLVRVHCLTDRLLLELDRALVEVTLETLDRFLISERVEFEDVSGREGMLTLAGPAAREAVEKLLGAALPELPPRHHVAANVDGATVRVVRSDEIGEEGYDLWAPAPDLGPLWERVVGLGVRPVGREAWTILRVEAGMVEHGTDVDASTLLLEAPLADTYSLTKGCYVGQEVVARITYRGHVNRRIVGFVFPDWRLPALGAPVRVDGKEVGRVTSAVVSPATGRGLALGFLRREYWAPGTAVEVGDPAGGLSAEVAELPFHRRGS
jgi:glycine cleavage system T protein (aminomethyltransferase)